jgi:prophage regulatory protein
MEPKYLRCSQVVARYGLARSTLYKMCAESRFPLPVRLGARAVGWPVAELEAWEAGRTTSTVGKVA